MLPKSRRLTRAEFWKVSQEGRSITGLQLSVKYLNNALGYSRWAVVVSTKLAKRAVVRNRLRRRIFRQLSIVNCPLSIDVIIFPKASVLNLDDAQLSISLDQVLQKISGLSSRP